MRYLVLLSICLMISLAACKKGCYRCTSNTACAVCVRGTDSFQVCYTIATIADSLAKYTKAGYKCTIYSGLQYSIDVCEDDSMRMQLQRDSYTCNKE